MDTLSKYDRDTLAEYEQKLDLLKAHDSAKAWWHSLCRNKELVAFARDLEWKRSTIAEAFEARERAGGDDSLIIASIGALRQDKDREQRQRQEILTFEHKLELANAPERARRWWLGLPRNAEMVKFAQQLGWFHTITIADAYEARQHADCGDDFTAILARAEALRDEKRRGDYYVKEIFTYEEKLNLATASEAARSWWHSLSRNKDLLDFAHELSWADCTISEAYEAREHAGCGNDFDRILARWEAIREEKNSHRQELISELEGYLDLASANTLAKAWWEGLTRDDTLLGFAQDLFGRRASIDTAFAARTRGNCSRDNFRAIIASLDSAKA